MTFYNRIAICADIATIGMLVITIIKIAIKLMA